MDPLTALSVASNIIQFVDFGSRLVSKAHRLYRSADGALTEHIHLEVIITDLGTLLKGLQGKLPEHRQPLNNQTVIEDDKALDDLCKRAAEIAEELMRRLEKLMIDPKRRQESTYETTGPECEEFKQKNQPKLASYESSSKSDSSNSLLVPDRRKLRSRCFRKWMSFQKALEASWSKNDIEEMAAILRELRSEIEFRLMVLLRGTLNHLSLEQSHMSTQLTQSTKLILNSFVTARDELASQIRDQAEKIIQSQYSQLYGEAKNNSQQLEDFLRSKLDQIGSLQLPRGIKTSEEYVTGTFAHEYAVEDEIHTLITENGILGSLSFISLMDRRESVDIPYQNTFEWIYEDLEGLKRPWSSFVDWLRQGDGIYWINGKAESGKSTLMRYIYDNDRTKKELREWASSMPSITCSFFFWNRGDEYQKSQCGLLRSLLFEILQRNRKLIPEVMPEVWSSWSANAKETMYGQLPLLSSSSFSTRSFPWRLPQLKRCFRKLVDALKAKNVKVCLFIDGLDEYEGDYSDIVELLQIYFDSPNLKMCLSSRPILVFENAFADRPCLKLQDLTYGDISHYVKDRLYRHKYMVQLSKRNAAEVSNLVDEIVTKSSGVFLWVKLVVRSILRGLSDYNRISDLKRRVKYLPEDLEALYFQMLKAVDSFYHEQASRIFQIVKVAQERSPGKLTLLTLYWAEEEDEVAAETAPIQKYDDEELAIACQMMDARLKSVCAGLLESYDPPFSDISPDAKVVYMHRTVTDWLAKPLVWDKIVSYTTEERRFSPNYAMLRSCVMQLKTAKVTASLPLDMNIISDALHYAKASEIDLNSGFPVLLDQLDIAASYHWRTAKANPVNGVLAKGNRRQKHQMSIYRSSMLASKKKDFSARNARFDLKPFDDADLDLDLNFDNEDSFCEEEEDELALRNSSEEGALHHWSYGLKIPGIKRIGEGTTFYDLANDLGLSHYVSMKYDSAIIDDQDVNDHLLTHFSFNSTVPDPQFVERILSAGTDPNFSYDGNSPWEGVLLAAASHFNKYFGFQDAVVSSESIEWRDRAEKWAEVLKVFVKHGAKTAFRTRNHPRLHGHPRISLGTIVTKFPEYFADLAMDFEPHSERKELAPDVRHSTLGESRITSQPGSTSMTSWAVSLVVGRLFKR